MLKQSQPLSTGPDLLTPSVLKPWIVCLTAALFFFYELMQLNMFGAIHDDLIKHLSLSASQFGFLSSLFLISNVFFLIPAGYLLDKYSTKRIILTALALCILGTYMFSFVTTFAMASVARFLTGIGSAFCFVGCIRLGSRWFPQEKMALVTGCIVTIAMSGGFMAQTPMSILIQDFGWKQALVIDALCGIAIFAVIALIVEDMPSSIAETTDASNQLEISRADMVSVYRKRNNWYVALYTSFINLPLVTLGAVWGIPYLTHVHHFSNEASSLITSMLFLGIIIGSPLIGWVSDSLRMRKPIMIIGAVAILFVSLLLIFIPSHNFKLFLVLFFLLGFISSAQVLSYPLVSATNRPELTATAVSIISFVTQGGGAVYQTIYGMIVDKFGHGVYIHGMIHYLDSAYHYAFIMIPVGALISLAVALQLKESA